MQSRVPQMRDKDLWKVYKDNAP